MWLDNDHKEARANCMLNTNFKIALYKKVKENTTTRVELSRLILKSYI